MKEPVEVIIRTTGAPTRRATLDRAIASVIDQRNVAARAVVVVAAARPDPGLARLRNECVDVHCIGAPASPGKALQAGRAVVQSTYFGFLDDDDELLPDALSVRLDAMRDEPDLHLAVTTGYWSSGACRRIHIPDIARHQDDVLAGIIERCWLASCGGLFRAAIVPQRYFDGLPDLCEWTSLAFRLALAGSRIRFIEQPTYNVYDSSESLSKSEAFMDATLRVLDEMRRQRLPGVHRAMLERKYRAALHDTAERYRRASKFALAWRCHLQSMKPPYTLRYAAYTRKLLWPAGGLAT